MGKAELLKIIEKMDINQVAEFEIVYKNYENDSLKILNLVQRKINKGEK